MTKRPPLHLRPVQSIAVIGSGIAGLSAAWRLSQTHNVTLLKVTLLFFQVDYHMEQSV